MSRKENNHGTNRDENTYYDERWDDIRRRREAVKMFIEYPSEEHFRDVLDTLWGVVIFGNETYINRCNVFNKEEPVKYAEKIEAAAENQENLGEVLNLNGLALASATQILQSLKPETFAICNDKSVSAINKLGYNYPEYGSTSFGVDRYWNFVDDVKDIASEYPVLEKQIEEDTVPTPEDRNYISDLVIADSAFNAIEEDSTDLSIRDLQEQE